MRRHYTQEAKPSAAVVASSCCWKTALEINDASGAAKLN